MYNEIKQYFFFKCHYLVDGICEILYQMIFVLGVCMLLLHQPNLNLMMFFLFFTATNTILAANNELEFEIRSRQVDNLHHNDRSIHDEVDLAEGQLNFKEGGGLNSHNGPRSIADKLQTRDFMRLQFGIGRPPGKMPVADYVLRELKGNNLEDFLVTAQTAADQVEQLLRS